MENQSIESDKIINNYQYVPNFYNGFAILMIIDNNQSLISPIVIYNGFPIESHYSIEINKQEVERFNGHNRKSLSNDCSNDFIIIE